MIKGSLNNPLQLPTNDQQLGDTYLVARERAAYVWNGSGWDRKSMSEVLE